MNADIEILKKDINSSIERLIKRRRGNKKKAERVVVLGAGISAVTTISIGLTALIDSLSQVFSSIGFDIKCLNDNISRMGWFL
ncbi:MAG: hypothetical protein K8F52_07075 [Candidatus Scalindua rubra]|uniref:Uncharacterized protein n=1 Tax=Candidatus Scalindua brodae TaxID=237368 RepID=A0A0B0EEU2_9BACT|nr:MAG: hypothetical protein SCABRO_02632 [Candidatus Scalindua brodae]MBZ0108415.1 hypothetical protein [Candidatus Scalindua rubra]